MEIVPIKLLWMTLTAVLLGMSAGLLNDISRLVRVFFGVSYGKKRFAYFENIKLPIIKTSLGPIKTGKIQKILLPPIMFIQDILLFAFAGAGVAILNYYFNNGRGRVYTPLATILGFLLYYFTVGRASVYLFEIFSFVLRATFRIIFSIIYCPLRHFVEFFGIIAKKIHKNLQKTIAKKTKKVYNNNKEKCVMKEAVSGFLEITGK